VFVCQCFCNLLGKNLSLQQLQFDCLAALSPQQLFLVRAAVRISANMRSYAFRFDTTILNNDSAMMFGLRDRQQFRKALGLSLLSDTELDHQSDLETHFCVSTEVVTQSQKLLGEGQFGCVYSCQLKGREVCVKEPKVTNYNVVQVQTRIYCTIQYCLRMTHLPNKTHMTNNVLVRLHLVLTHRRNYTNSPSSTK
jgi:hypothetical protein